MTGQRASMQITLWIILAFLLDAAGCLALPKEFLAQLNIKGRVQLELTETGVLAKPTANADYAEEAETRVEELVLTHRARGLRGLLQRLRES